MELIFVNGFSNWKMSGLSIFLVLAIMAGVLGYVDTETYISDLDKPAPMAHVQGVLGKKAALPCDVKPLAADDLVSMVLWFKEKGEGQPIYSYDVRGRLATQPRLWSAAAGFGPRAYFRALSSPAVLFIDSVAATDAGMYRCRVDFENSPTRNLKINFTVITPPERPVIVDTKTRDQTRLLEPYKEGDTIEISCEVSGGDPKPRVIWYLENTVLDDSYSLRSDGVTANNLTFPNVGRQHLNARLVCQASNTNLAPPETKLIILDLYLRPLTVEILDKNVQLSADRSYEIECKTTGSKPEAQVTWWKNDRPVKRGVKNFSETNATLSVLTLVPESEDHNAEVVCRAENPRLPDAVIEDRWKLNVHFVPIVSLRLGAILNPNDIKEGEDIYFECIVKANPKVLRLTWYKEDQEIQHHPSRGIILTDQGLVLQRVTRATMGDYRCSAYNSEGRATSNSVSLLVRYAPMCKTPNEGEVYGALKHETVQLLCTVDSSPPPTSFTWIFNSSGEQSEISSSLHNKSGYTSTLSYTPQTDLDYGTILCSASNYVGKQDSPCVYRLIAAGRPMAVQNCTVLNQSSSGLQVECIEGFDGGLPQVFHMEVLELPSMIMIANVSSEHSPTFEVPGLNSHSGSFALLLYASNSKGRGEEVTLYTVAVGPPDKYTANATLPLTPVLMTLVVVAVLLGTGVCGVITALYRRHTARQDIQKQPPSNNELYTEPSLESLTKKDNLNQFKSPKLQFSSQCELKVDLGDQETDPDIIPCYYERKPLECNQVMPPDYASSMYDRLNIPPSSSSASISVMSRGVCARSTDIAAAQAREVVTTARKVKESCI
ncbi:protein turtle-like [Plodia interpunctella]|uniref:protein turtle-like n=1 Tax=Plodia interpunctella TaxID=58824 RepID=UPI002368ADE2|nr:protein turtle-like [Plodia interpunctella]